MDSKNCLKFLCQLCQRIPFALMMVTTLLVTLSNHSLANPIPERSILPPEPTLTSDTYLLMDYDSEQVLAAKDIDRSVAPASVTKMMTMYVVDQELKNNKLKLEDLVTISKNAWQTQGSRMFVEVGKQVKVADLIKGVIIQSGNDASVALAEHIAGSEAVFADIMNSYAQMLGMTNSHFVNATGLPDPDHYVTAKDLAILAKALIHDFPETYKIYSQKEFVFNNIKQVNRNRLLWRNEAVDGIKTGHTETAGYCLVSSAKKDGMRLISIVMGSKTPELNSNETNKLITWGFRFFETHKLYQAGEAVDKIRIWMGDQQQLGIGFIKDLYITIPRGQYKKLAANTDIPAFIKAPTKAGAEIGMYRIQLQDQALLERPLVALTEVNSGSLWRKVKDSISLNAQRWWAKVFA